VINLVLAGAVGCDAVRLVNFPLHFGHANVLPEPSLQVQTLIEEMMESPVVCPVYEAP
jgi:hypothetical protein